MDNRVNPMKVAFVLHLSIFVSVDSLEIRIRNYIIRILISKLKSILTFTMKHTLIKHGEVMSTFSKC